MPEVIKLLLDANLILRDLITKEIKGEDMEDTFQQMERAIRHARSEKNAGRNN
jgi:hypothetical protein